MTTASSYTYDTAGNRASKSAAGAIADYSWDAEGLLSAVTGDPDQNGEYVYDASGQRLVRTDAAGTRVFLPGGQEILIVGTSVSAMRYYSFGGTSVAVRTGPGMGGVSSLVCDAHGSVVASVPNTVWTAGSVKRVFSDPFGAVREGSDATGSGGHQFLGAVRDTSSGLTLLGARYYDESVGRFISVDPVLDPGLPAQFNAYVYSGNNPATWSDPSGTLWQGGQWRSDAPAASSSSGVKKKTGTTVPASTSPAALQQCPDVSCRASWLVGFQVQMFGGIAEGIGALLWMTCVLCTTVQSTVENFDMFTDWDGFTARKMAEAQAQQALFAAGPGAVWDAITKPIVDDWANNPGHALGGTLVTVGTFAIPGGGVLKGVRGVKAAEEAVTVAANAGGDFSRIIMTSPRQLQSKFKHASDFGVAGNYSKANAAEFSAALNQHINSAGTRAIQGTYRGQSVTHYLDSSTRLNVILRNGEFVSGWKLSPDQLANVLRNGSLGGG